MSVLVGELLQDAYLFAGIGDQYNPMDADSTNLAMRFLNDLADSFSADSIKVFNITAFDVPLIPGVRKYVLGPGSVPATIPFQPAQIDEVSIIEGGISYPVKLIGVRELNQDVVFLDAPGRPIYWTFDQEPTTMSVYLWPTPTSSAAVARLYMWTPIAQVSSVGDLFTGPPGYRLFFKTALGKVLASVNKIQLSKDQNDVIAAAELAIKALNVRRRVLATDIPQDKTGGRFNIFTGYPR